MGTANRVQILNEAVYISRSANNLRKFLSFSVFGLFSSSLLLFPQRFGRHVLWPSYVCWTFIESTEVACSDSVSFKRLQVLCISVLLFGLSGLNLQPPDDCRLREPTPITVTLYVLQDSLEWIFGTYTLKVLTRIITIMYDFLPVLVFILFLFNLFNYRFPYCIHLYTWPT